MAIRSFGSSLRAFRDKTKESMNTTTRRVVLGIGTGVINRNPVGTPATTGVPGYLGGHSKRNWQFGLNQAPTGIIQGRDSTGQRAIEDIFSKIPKNAAGHVHYLANNVKYIKELENGSSKQAPQGMVAITILDFQKIVKESIR